MKILKKTILILLISIILLYSIIPHNIVYAEENGDTLSSAAEAGQIIASFAKDMVENHAAETIYDYGDYWPNVGMPQNYGRLMAYQGVKVTGQAQGSSGELRYAEDKYFMDCVGFVSFCIHHSLGISGNSDGNFVTPNGLRSSNFEYVTDGSLQPGDILVRSGSHVMIYVEPNYVTEAQDVDSTWQVKRRGSWPTYDSVVRIKNSAAKQIPRSQTKSAWDGVGSSTGVITPTVDDSKAFEQYIDNDYQGTIDVTGRNNSENFYYNGTPKKGEYLGKTDKSWIFEALENAADWLLGIMTMNIKIQVVGWTSIFDDTANKVVEAVSDTELLKERVTVEDIIYNRVPILDVNMFNFDEAGGQKLEKTNVIYLLREKIAEGYVLIRTVCIILLLFTLIYLGIRTAISSVAKDKADYKQKLVSWVVSFIVVMFIHYFMLVVLNLNETAISFVAPPSDSSATIYEQVRAYAYEIPATKGWTGAIIYVFLVYYLIKMLLFYFKRVLIVYILAIVSPALGIAYSIQRINGKSKALGIWMKEFIFNVLIQFVHASIYTIMMGTILKIMSNATVLTIIPYTILLIILLNFLLSAEDIIKNIFRIKSNSLKSVMATVFDFKNRFAVALGVGSFLYGKGKKVAVNAYDKHLTNTVNAKYDQYKVQGDSEFAQSVNKEIERLKEQEKEHQKELTKNSIDFAKNQFKGTVALVTGVPAIFEQPIAGGIAFAYAASNLNTGLGNKRKQGVQAEKLDKTTEGTQYLYIENPNNVNNTQAYSNGGKNTNQTERNTSGADKRGVDTSRKRNINSNGVNADNTEKEENSTQKQIRRYNTNKNKTYKVSKAILSWTTVGRSKVIENVFSEGIEENELIEKVYSTRIQKLSVIGNIAVKQINEINQEMDKIKNSNYPPIYYTPKQNETKTQIAMNEKLREKYRDILEKNIIQIYEGIDKDKINEHVVNYTKDKVTLKSVEEIAKEYLSENECNIGEEFKNNFDNILREKIIDTVQKNKDGFEKIKLKPDLEEKIQKAISNNSEDKEKLNQEIDNIVTDDIKEQIVSKISAKDLTELLSKTLEAKGSVEVNKDFKNLQEPIDNLRLVNKEAEATVGNTVYTTKQLLDLIMNKDITE